VRTVPGPVVASAATQLVLFLSLAEAVGGLDVGPAAVALAFAVAGWVVLAEGLADSARRRLGPADHVTVTRATIACVVAALTAEAVAGHAHAPALVALASVALVLDAVDGQVARRTGSTTGLGARMDMEVDAFLILVLSVSAGLVLGWWVLAIGVFRYAFLTATWMVPWLGGAVPPRYWRKAVAALQGIVLTVATAEVLPRGASEAAVALALALLVWSFATQTAGLAVARSRAPGGRGKQLTPHPAPAPARALR
jgi:phosphatidylglycerophosphate synthase